MWQGQYRTYWWKTVKKNKARSGTLSCDTKSKSNWHTGHMKRIDLMVWKGLMLIKWIKLALRSIRSVPFIKIHHKPVIGSILKKTHENNDDRDHRASLIHSSMWVVTGQSYRQSMWAMMTMVWGLVMHTTYHLQNLSLGPPPTKKQFRSSGRHFLNGWRVRL